MKCNKCLKKIHKGEEIRVYGGDLWGSNYGGNYCETCWKTKHQYERCEDGGKELKNENKGNNKMPTWGWGAIVVLGLLSLVFLLLWLKDKKEE